MQSRESTKSQSVRLLQQLLLQGKYVFDKQDAIAVAVSENIPINQLNKILSNLAKRRQISRLRRGLYVIHTLLAEEMNSHPFIIATHLIQPSAISHWSALQHHGLTEQIPQCVTASTTRKVITPSMRKKQSATLKEKHAWKINGIRFEYINVLGKNFFGIEKIWLDEHSQVSVTDKERTLLDVFISPKMFGGMGEALGLLENVVTNINIQKLVDYALRYGKKSVIKRLGWSLEYFGVEEHILKPLLEASIHYYCRLDPTKKAVGHCD